MRTKIDDSLARSEEEHAHDPERAEVIARVRRFKSGWYELAEALTEQRKSERFRAWGFADFDDYCKRELHLRKETVEKLTGSFSFLRTRAPEVLRRDGRSGPIPTYQAVDFLRRAEEQADAPEETVREIRRHVLDEGASLPKISRLYQQVVFPMDADELGEKRRGALRSTVDRLVQLLAEAREEGLVPRELAAEIEEPLSRLTQALAV